jgi:hypothetical protein
MTAWQRTSPKVTVKGFQKYCTSNAVDETDDSILWNGSEKDGVVRNECKEDEGTDCEDGDRH